jgi:predicted RNase H-like HicB family nuclease
MRPTYEVNAERTDAWWAITVSGLPEVFSQARRLDQVEGMAREAIALYLDASPDSFDVTVRQVPEAANQQVELETVGGDLPGRS